MPLGGLRGVYHGGCALPLGLQTRGMVQLRVLKGFKKAVLADSRFNRKLKEMELRIHVSMGI